MAILGLNMIHLGQLEMGVIISSHTTSILSGCP
uniref:Uncharacterized protein n=1 Tax=Arundo donax TaxID=35708 RepID=A0A0A9CPF3_ARUDO